MAQREAHKPSALCEKRGHGSVALCDRVTKVRTEYWLGPWGEPATREAYHRLAAEWEASGRRLPDRPKSIALREASKPAALTIAAMLDEAWVQAVRPYVRRQVEALMQLQLFTGARGGELFMLRPVGKNGCKESALDWRRRLGKRGLAEVGSVAGVLPLAPTPTSVHGRDPDSTRVRP